MPHKLNTFSSDLRIPLILRRKTKTGSPYTKFNFSTKILMYRGKSIAHTALKKHNLFQQYTQIYTSAYIPKGNKVFILKRCLYSCVHCSIIHNI